MIAPAPIQFWFELSSPYAYFMAQRIDQLGERHGRAISWRPFLLGAVFKVTGMAPLTHQSLRGDYARRDWERLARLHQLPFRLPLSFQLSTVAAARMIYAVEAVDSNAAGALTKQFFSAIFGHGTDLSSPAIAAAVGESIGLDRHRLLAAAADEKWKRVLRERTEEALALGVFGSPFVLVDGEGFWGFDRLGMIDAWLERGGW